MSPKPKRPTTHRQKSDKPPPIHRPKTPSQTPLPTAIRTLLAFRSAFLNHLKGKTESTPFRPVNQDEWHFLQETHGADLSAQTSKLVKYGDGKYAWLFKVGEILQGLQIKNVRLIVERDVSGDYVFLDCASETVGEGKWRAVMGKGGGEEGATM